MTHRARRRLARAALTFAVAAAVVPAAGIVPATAVDHDARPPAVSAQPAAWTPDILSPDTTVRQLVPCGQRMYAVGDFTEVGHRGNDYTRSFVFSFNASTGAITPWHPNITGTVVDTVALSPDCTTAYLGGVFDRVNRTNVRDIVAVTTRKGSVRRHFTHSADGEVQTLSVIRGGAELVAGGAFTSIAGTPREHLASLSPSSGRVTSYLDLPVEGPVPGSTGRTLVHDQQISADGTRLLLEGNFDAVGGQPRMQMAELDLGFLSATVDPWSNPQLQTTQCSPHKAWYARDGAFSPDASTIYLAATGQRGNSPFCDAVSAIANTRSGDVLWTNKTGGDSLYSVAASDTDVYIGGHERWADNPLGRNDCRTTCVARKGIGDIDPGSGLATRWDPGRSRGRGADDLVLTDAGLWIASDTYFDSVTCAHRHHPGICFFPQR